MAKQKNKLNAAPKQEAKVLSADERRAQGKALRNAVPRESHGGWKPPKKRRDPVDILIESNEGRMADLVPIRFGRMSQSPFAFYRGAAAIMAADLAATPDTGLRVQAYGDVKLSAVIEGWDVDSLENYGRLCAVALARAHARSGDAALLAGYMGASTVFDEAICEFAVEYADQNKRDYRAFVNAIREGRIEASVESA
jgi:hypothetical protein